MQVALRTSGVLLVVVGAVWFFQGINVIPGSFMTGQPKWAVYGAIMLVAGVAMVVRARRGRG